MANHFVRAIGLSVGRSLLEEDKVAARARDPRHLQGGGQDDRAPVRLRRREIAGRRRAGARTVGISKIPADAMALDVGQKTIEQFERLLAPVKTIFWNGPMGVFEKPPFDRGHDGARDAARRVRRLHRRRRRRERRGRQRGRRRRSKFGHVSTGGGASLEFLTNGTLPGIEALEALTTRPLFVANWKMNWTRARGARVRAPSRRADRRGAPDASSSSSRRRSPRSTRRGSGGRVVARAPRTSPRTRSGAFTGEVSAAMLAEAGCRYVIVGHSERRRLFGETPATLCAASSRAPARRGSCPIYCLGETEEERERGLTDDDPRRAGRDARAAIRRSAPLVVAYEPVWAIGTGRAATPADAARGARDARGAAREPARPASGSSTAAP